MRLKDPLFLLLALTIIPVIWFYIRRERKSNPSIRFSDLTVLRSLQRSPLLHIRHIVPALRCAAILLFTIALARPQKGRSDEEVLTEGVDIVCVLDISESMRAFDFKPENRLGVAKQTLKEFIARRRNDRIGLVVFASRSFTKCPLTLDYDVLDTLIDEVTFTNFSNSTAIGTALATAAARIKDSPAKSKVMILVTDGASNAGEIPPLTAAEAAAQLGIKIYTIGVGREGEVPMPVEVLNPFTGERIRQIRNVQSDLDEKTLKEIAKATGGSFFRAHDPQQLRDIYNQIDKLEKTEIKSKIYISYNDHFYGWVWAGFACCMFELLLAYTRFRRTP